MAGVNDWRRGTVWSGPSSVKQRTLRGSLGRLNHFTEVDVIRVELGDRNCIWHLRIFTVTVRDAEGYGAKWCCSVGWWVGSWFRWRLIGRRVGSSSVVVVVVGVVAVVPGAPGVISVGSGGCRPDWMGMQLVEVRLLGLWIGDVVSRSVVLGEIDDVEEPRESGVLAVIFVCMETGFCGPWGVS